MSGDRLIGSCNPNWQSCRDGISGWINGDPTLTWLVNIVIGIIMICLVWWLLWYLFSYRRRPYCAQCGEEGGRLSTWYAGASGETLCYDHLIEQRKAAAQRKADNEPIYECPRHRAEMQKVLAFADLNFIILDQCPDGCQFHDEGENEKLIEHARSEGYRDGHSDGQSAGQTQGFVFGMLVG